MGDRAGDTCCSERRGMNWGFWFMIGTLLGLVLCILYSALVVASKSDEEEEKKDDGYSHISE